VLPVPPLAAGDATRLFTERAVALRPGFEPIGPEAEQVAEICHRLDGLPLAIELAAARLRAMSVGELAGRLDDRFRVLGAGARDAPARQRTLRAMIDWSWEPLPDPERMVLRRLAVHAGSATLDSAEAVVGDGVERGSVLDLVTGLVDRSLLVLIDGGRYRMLESVAVYARERLDEAGETASAVARHFRYFTELAEHADARLRGPEQQAWLARLDADSANLTLAVRRALDAEAAEDAVRLVAALGWYWYLRGRHAEASRLLTAAGPASAGLARAAGPGAHLVVSDGVGQRRRR
jgi:predicted ATPase